MITKEHSVKEFHFTFDVMPGQVFKIQAETQDKALKVLKGKLAAIVKELAQTKQNQINQPTA